MSTTPAEPAASTDGLRLRFDFNHRALGIAPFARLQLHFCPFHEAYHIGQIGLMRRVVGKPGAI